MGTKQILAKLLVILLASLTVAEASLDRLTVKSAYVNKGESKYEKPRIKPGPKAKALHSLQIYALTHPDGFLGKLLIPLYSNIGGIVSNADSAHKQRLMFGNNFVYCGEVCLSGFSDVAHAITTPQARTFRLGRTPHAPRRMPKGVGGRNIWMLSLSQKGAGGDGTHEALRKSMEDHIIGADALKRQKDPVAQLIVHQLLVDYKAMTRVQRKGWLGRNKKIVTNEKFLTDNWLMFWTRYMHYCLFGINPLDETKINVIRNFFYKSNKPLAVLYYATLVGPLVGLLTGTPKGIKKVTKIYEESPALATFLEAQGENPIQNNELAKAMIPIMVIAGMVGPMTLAGTSLGFVPLAEHQFAKKKIDVTKVWDKIDLDSKTEVEQYIYECGRLDQPVSATHRVATEPFTVKIGGRDRTFPTGTTVNIPIGLSMVNEDFWGDTTYEFDHKRENLCPFSMIFHSVGTVTNGRVCPGKYLAMNLITDLVVGMGKIRRELLN